MKTTVIGTKSSGFSVSVIEGWGKIDGGYPAFWGSTVATGFATAEEAFAWAAEFEGRSAI